MAAPGAQSERPWTFYGMIAERQLGLSPTVTFTHPVAPPDVRLAEAGDLLAQLIRVASTETAAALVAAERVHG